jgi:hypothetical protein
MGLAFALLNRGVEQAVEAQVSQNRPRLSMLGIDMKTTLAVTCALALVFGNTALAKDKVKVKTPHGKDPHVTVVAPKPAAKVVVQAPAPVKPPHAQVSIVFSAGERDIIHTYVKSCTVVQNGTKPKGLPPGLAKKVARGGELPPGWQKKCIRGQILSADVYKLCHPLPPDLIVKLPAPPAGTILVTIDGKVLRLAKASLEILDVFDVL